MATPVAPTAPPSYSTEQPEAIRSASTPSMESKHDDKETNVITSTQAPQYNLDPEKQSSRVGSIQEGDDRQPRTWRQQLRGLTFGNVWRKIRVFRYIFLWLLFTTWLIYGIVYHRDDYGWLVPTLFYIGLCMRLFFNWVPSRLAMIPIRWVWQHTAFKVYEAIPSKLHQPLAALVTLAVFLIGSFVPEETGDNTRAKRAVSIFGLLVMILLLAVTSRDFKRIPWHTVIGGMLTQYIIAVFVLRTQAGYDIFSFISGLARTLLGFATDGLVFLTTEEVRNIHWFLVSVVPAIIFFIALVQLLYHIGLLQWTIVKFATFFFWTLRVSGAEAVVAAATPFIGQGESAMLIRPFISRLTLAELHQIMTCGFATIAGSVLVAYIGLGLNPQALVSSCIMSIPASLAVSKLRYPETEETMTSGKVEIPEDEDEGRTVNALHAFSNGAWLGIKIGATIIASLLCVIALVALVDGFLGWWGKYYDVPQLSLTYLLGYILWVPSWLLGVSDRDVHNVARLIGMKIIANEYVAFNSLKTMEPYISMTPRSQLIATYACCGFGNVSSLGIQIGILSQLAPKRAGDVVKVAVSALFSGVLATLTSASVAGMLFVHAS